VGGYAVAAAPSRVRLRAIFSDALRLYTRQWRHLIPSALVLTLASSILALALDIVLGGAAGTIGTALVGVLTLFFLPLWLQAIDLHTRTASRRRDESGFLAALEGVRSRLPAITAAVLLIALLETFGFVLLIVPGFILATRWSLIMPAMIIEGLGVRAGMRRSRELVRGHGWRVFGTLMLNGLIVAVPVILLTLALAPFFADDYAEFFRTITIESLFAPFTALVLTSLYDALAPGDLPELEQASAPAAFTREAKAPAIIGRALAVTGAALTIIGLFFHFFDLEGSVSAFEGLQSTDLLVTEIGVTCIALIGLSFFSRTRLPLLAVAILGFFNLGQTLPDKPLVEHLARGGYLSLGGAIVMCTGAVLALLAPPARPRS
jgi:glycerophosphoryl diester phosphodiesterase family protein